MIALPVALPDAPPIQSASPTVDPARLAAAWFAQLTERSRTMPREEPLPERPIAVLAAFASIALAAGRSLMILVPDDEPLPDLSNALDLTMRPLCLVLPGADFAARIALRATLSLMRSRLARDDEEEQTPAWQQQRERINQHAALWQETQQWVAKNDRNPWPAQVADLFPAKILPIAAYRSLQQKSSDITLLYRCDAPVELIVAPGSLLHVGMRSELPSGRKLALGSLGSETERLRIELAQLSQDVADMELELATAQGEMADFTRRYYELVGRRMVELDALQAKLAREEAEQSPERPEVNAEAEQKEQRAEQSARESQRFTEAQSDEPTSFRPKSDVKRLFRQLAQKIHPDRASSESDRNWRTQLMSEANRAYRAGDADALHEVAKLWDEGRREPIDEIAFAASNSGTETKVATSPPPNLVRQVERMRGRLAEIDRELHRLFGSRLYELFIAARQARRMGRDLLVEMADKLDDSITSLRQQLAVKA